MLRFVASRAQLRQRAAQQRGVGGGQRRQQPRFDFERLRCDNVVDAPAFRCRAEPQRPPVAGIADAVEQGAGSAVTARLIVILSMPVTRPSSTWVGAPAAAVAAVVAASTRHSVAVNPKRLS